MSGSNSSARGGAPSGPVADEPLSFAVHSMNGPDLRDPQQGAQRSTKGGRIKMMLVLLVCAAPVIASYFTYFVIRPEGRTNYSSLILPSKSLPDLPLQALDGSTVKASSLRGQWLLVAVGPSACDAACEKRLFMQRQLREMLGRERDRVDKVWLITDTGALTPALREALGGNAPVTTLRVPAEAVAAWLAADEGRKLQDHLYLVDPMGEWMMRVPADPEPNRVKRDLDRVLRGSASWDQAGR